MHHYEMMVCFRPDLDEEALGSLSPRLSAMVVNQGGEVTKESSMGRRRLAYPIQRFHEGIYQVVNFTLDAAKVEELERHLRLDEDIIRHIVIKENE